MSSRPHFTSPAQSRPKAVDLVTGKATVEYFYDPTLEIGSDASNDGSGGAAGTPFKGGGGGGSSREAALAQNAKLYSSRHLFVPCTVVKALDSGEAGLLAEKDTGLSPALVKTSDGTLHKVRDVSKLIPLRSPEDYMGLSDLLQLPHVTEASLLHNLRMRYGRDDIYTSAGSILVSVNPYKPITLSAGGSRQQSLYSDEQMILYKNGSSFLAASSDRLAAGALRKGGVAAASNVLPPHLFGIADKAYCALLKRGRLHVEEEDPGLAMEAHNEKDAADHHPHRNQSIIISGESGAGKTEATKIIMQYLARRTQLNSLSAVSRLRPSSSNTELAAATAQLQQQQRAESQSNTLEQRVLSSNPLLESFGNARTLRNDNSSRFGKFIQIVFDRTSGNIVGATIADYLLEKTRITHQIEGERNYHIFYQLLHGADDALLAELGLTEGMTAFRYLGQRSAKKSKKDMRGFVETKECLARVGLDEADQNILFSFVAAVLHLGNVAFEESSESAKVSDASAASLDWVCQLLGLDKNQVKDAMLTKIITVGGKSIHKPQNVTQAMDKRDAFSKLAYSSLFVWLVKKVNETIAAPAKGKSTRSKSTDDDDDDDDGAAMKKPTTADTSLLNTGYIGVLDIYGFEQFDTNGFEQLLINYANEKMQWHFNRHLFEMEQKLYAAEGVDWTYITFNDNRPCLELIEGGNGSVGILSTLDDAWGGVGTPAEKDIKFVSQLHQQFGERKPDSNLRANLKKVGLGVLGNNHANYVTPKFGSDRQFIVVHYAGEVRYTAHGFVAKNVETLSHELKVLGSHSTVPLTKEIFVKAMEGDPSSTFDPGAGGGRRTAIRGISVASQFRSSLQGLVTHLEKTQPHYIRCIKPNLNKAAGVFDAGEVLRQLRYAGMMEAIRIRREGYALREDHESFYERFRILLTPKDLAQGDGIEYLVKVLSERFQVTDADWQIGHSRIFLKRELADKLETLSMIRVHAAARTVGRFGRSVAQERAGQLLSAWARFRLHMLQYYREKRASSKIAATVRMHTQRKLFRAKCFVAMKLQAFQRMKMAIEYAALLRDPYKDYNFKQLEKYLKEEEARLDEAVKTNNYAVAAEIEGKLGGMKEALEAKRPMTRKILEGMIDKLENEKNEAMENKEFTKCAEIQERLDEMTARRTEFPSIDELKEAIKAAEAYVAEAAKSRDFAEAASRQAAVDEAKKRLEDTIATEQEAEEAEKQEEEEAKVKDTGGFASRSELEAEITKVRSELTTAISAKDFASAATLQESLENLENLREALPTLKELKDKLADLKRKFNDAIRSKKFADAGDLQPQMDQVEKQIEVENAKGEPEPEPEPEKPKSVEFEIDGETLVFVNRVELETAISKYNAFVQEAVAKQDFAKAKSTQETVDELEALRKYLPSVTELRAELVELKKTLDLAVSKKDFDHAAEIRDSVAKLQEALVEQKKAEAAYNAEKKRKMMEKQKQEKKALMEKQKKERQEKLEKQRKEREAKQAAARAAQPVVGTPVRLNNNNAMVRARPIVVAATSRGGVNGTKKTPGQSDKPVSKLRPKKATVSLIHDEAVALAQSLSENRTYATVVVNDNGDIAGILTEQEFTLKLIAEKLDPDSTTAQEIMIPDPPCVSGSDSAVDALSTMIEHRIYHVPVLEEGGGISGMLDIAHCLNDAISKLENAHKKKKNATAAAAKQLLETSGADILQGLSDVLGGGGTFPTLGSILEGKPVVVVEPDTSLEEVGLMMAEARKAALVVENGALVGLFGFKDMMSRAIAKRLFLDSTPVSEVMTMNPETVSPDTTILEALHSMHDHNFTTLPVCEEDGSVVGIVDVLDLVFASGGEEGWRSIFDSALDVDDEEMDPSRFLPPPPPPFQVPGGSPHLVPTDNREVSRLRPRKPVFAEAYDTVVAVSKILAKNRRDASLINGRDGRMVGIMTDKDITRRVVGASLNPAETLVEAVMTPNPTCVSMSDSAMAAMETMIENRFRHLPVLDQSGAVVGLLDIAKCLNDAITKLEKGSKGNSNTAKEAVKQIATLQGSDENHAALVQELLMPLMSQALGGGESPTLRSLLKGEPATVVDPDLTVDKVGVAMTAAGKAAVVVENGELVGIFGFKDMMSRVIAKERPLDSTAVSVVMTPNPETVSPDVTVVEALQLMHDHGFLTLPVCEENGPVVGIVDVMDLIYGSGGSEGWRSIFDSSLDIDDDESIGSARSAPRSVKSAHMSESVTPAPKRDERLVSKLRPRQPLFTSPDESVKKVAQKMAEKRRDASLVKEADGSLAGIFTDVDVTRRVVAENLDPTSTEVSAVMTRNPTMVSLNDPAMDALAIMIENRFRHLPVMDENGAVVGLLEIAKCLDNAITRIENAHQKKGSADTVKQLELLQDAGIDHTSLQELLMPLMEQSAEGGSAPTLRSILRGDAATTIVRPGTNVRDTGVIMTRARKAALVVEDGKLTGIFSFKDMMSRVVAKGLPVDDTDVTSVMTENPETASPETTTLEALQVMHDHGFLTLPVCEEDGTIVGIVDVMDLVYNSGGKDGWRSIFDSALDMADEESDAGSFRTASVAVRSTGASHRAQESMVEDRLPPPTETPREEQTVSRLRPKKPTFANINDSVLAIAQMLARNRGDATLITGRDGLLQGILTDTDITRRVVAKHMDPASTVVTAVMTPNPTCVTMTDSAMEALRIMIENRFRHLPVLAADGGIAGVLDIAKCLHDAIRRLEKANSKKGGTSAAEEAVMQMAALEGAGMEQTALLQSLLTPVLSDAATASPTLRSLLGDTPPTIVEPGKNLRDTAMIMAEARKAALIVDEGELVGIFSFKDMMIHAVAQQLPMELTDVTSVMTPNPETVSPDTTVLEALQIMHDNFLLELPVVEDNGQVVGIVDVIDLVYGSGGAVGWQSIFGSALDLDQDDDDDASDRASVGSFANSQAGPLRARVPSQVQFGDHQGTRSIATGSTSFYTEYTSFDEIVFKVFEPSGGVHRIRCENRLDKLLWLLAKKMKRSAGSFQVEFVDDEGDKVLLNNDEDLADAVGMSQRSGNQAVKLTVVEKGSSWGDSNFLIAAASSGAVAAVVSALLLFGRGRR